MPKPLRIAHVTLARNLSAGQRKQLSFELNAGPRLDGIEWTVKALVCAPPQTVFEQSIPGMFRPILLCHIYAWWVTYRLSKTHDYVLLRHLGFDIFAFFFAPLFKNRISVHHTKEVEEIPLIRKGVVGRLAARMERYSAPFGIKRAHGVLGVTQDIAHYEVPERGLSTPYFVYPNGIDLNDIAVCADARDPKDLNAVFICGTFAPWHGLDRLIDAVKSYNPQGLTIHLIGKLNDQQRKSIQECGAVFVEHGSMFAQEFRPIIEKCDIAIASLAMDRQNLTEGATLKVREMLAMGLPMYSTHKDTALDLDFPYFFVDRSVVLENLMNLARRSKTTARSDVRNAASPHISKAGAMQKVGDWLRSDAFTA